MKTLTSSDISQGQRVLIRGSLNVSLDADSKIIDELRLVRTLETIDLIIGSGGIPILISHIKNDIGSTVEPIVNWFRHKGYQAHLVENYFPHKADIEFQTNNLYIFENLRNYPQEKAGDQGFAEDLAKYGDIYVNESFDSAHRSHASITSLPKLLPAFAGLNFSNEVEQLSKTFTPDRPYLFIIGGAKIETKAPLIRKLLEKADKVFVGGALMNPLLVANGHSVGSSLMPDSDMDLSDIAKHPKLVLPVDFIDQDRKVITPAEVKSNTKLLDIGPQSIEAVKLLIDEARLVVWNGPMGDYEDSFNEATDEIAIALSKSTAHSIIGGGDTLAAVNDEIQKGIEWISTGGGAMLDFIESDGQLPAIEVL